MTARACLGCETRTERVAACHRCAAAVLAGDLAPGDRVAPLHGDGTVYLIAGRPRLTHGGAVSVPGRREGEAGDGDLLFAACAELEGVAP